MCQKRPEKLVTNPERRTSRLEITKNKVKSFSSVGNEGFGKNSQCNRQTIRFDNGIFPPEMVHYNKTSDSEYTGPPKLVNLMIIYFKTFSIMM